MKNYGSVVYSVFVIKLLVWESNSENCLVFIFVASPCEKVFLVYDENSITYAIRKFMLDMPSHGVFQRIDLVLASSSPKLHNDCHIIFWFKMQSIV